MIAPMKKCGIVVLEKERLEALSALARMGVIHPEVSEAPGTVSASVEADMNKLVLAESIAKEALGKKGIKRMLKEKKAAAKAALTGPAGTGSAAEALAVEAAVSSANRILDLDAQRKIWREKINGIQAELARVGPWGRIHLPDIDALRERGYETRLCVIPPGFDALPASCLLARLGRAKKGEYALIIAPVDEAPGLAALERAKVQFVDLPKSSTDDLEAELAHEIHAGRDAFNELVAASGAFPAFAPAKSALGIKHRFERASESMGTESSLAWITGWVPSARETELTAEAEKRGWATIFDDPADDELPPTKIESKGIIKLIQPLFDFLGTVPGYREYEISPSFFLFFTIYVAMIVGDAGYGCLLLLVSLFAGFKAKAGGKRFPDALKLIAILSGATIVWGSMTGAWFSLAKDALPSFLVDFSLIFSPISSFAPDQAKVTENIKVFCFILGGLQLALAHLKNIIRDIRSPKFLGQVGSFCLVSGMFFLVLTMVVSGTRFPLPSFALWLIGGGFVLLFVFGNWTGNVFTSILESLKNFIPIFLGTVSVFADIVSYLRLWAVSLAGVAFAQTINNMGSQLGAVGGLMKIVGVLGGLVIILVGHGLNITLGGLSVIVHGVRLNLLEYSSHLGMEWSGYKYEPLESGHLTDEAKGA